MKISGLHHVTAIASDPQRNLDFYAGVLGLRLVKRTVNFDDPGSYHFYFGDETGTPGTILTFFPWPNARRGKRGTGEVDATAFSIPRNAVGYWLERLKNHNVSASRVTERFGEEVIRFTDGDGMLVELIASDRGQEARPWDGASVPVEQAIHGLHGVSASLDDVQDSATLLTDIFGYQLVGTEGNRSRYAATGAPGLGRIIDLVETPDTPRAQSAAGSVHHIAFRAANDDDQLVWRKKLSSLGYGVSPVMDRTYFHSIYFREPGGILFEIATDAPGFTEDENVAELGTHLRIPSWMESSRSRIEEILPRITLPTETAVQK